MESDNTLSQQYEKIKEIISECMQKLGIIETKQKKVVQELNKKTDTRKIANIKQEIEAL